MLAALLMFVFTYLLVGRWSNLSRMGSEIFSALGGFGIFYALLAGPLATVDCLSRERREGTLGLLFLTDLKGYDIVLGKMAATSFDMILGLTAALPLLAMPMLMGGINLAQFARLALGLTCVMFLSLAVGVLASALLTSSRAALALTIGALLFLTFGVAFLGEEVFKIGSKSRAAAFYYSICPLYTASLCLDLPLREPLWKYWTNVGVSQALAWMLVAIACWRTSRSWRDGPASAAVLRWRERIRGWARGSVRRRESWRRAMLDKNPLAWLEGRDRLQERLLWASFLLVVIYCAAKHLHSPNTWPDNDAILLWPWWAHCILCLWVVIQAPRRFADDKHSGAMELLLCTPLSANQIVRGTMQALRRRYGRILVSLLALDGFLVFAFFSMHDGWHGLLHKDVFPILCWGLVVFPIQLYSLIRISFYEALIQPNSVRASFAALLRVGLLPWLAFFVIVLGCDYASTRYKSLRITEALAYACWGLCHLVPCFFFVALANWRLRHRFRELAGSTARPAWLVRVKRLIWRRKPGPAIPQSGRQANALG